MTKNVVILFIVTFIIIFTAFLLLPEYNTYSQLNNELGVKTALLDPSNVYYAKIKSSFDYISSNKAALSKVDNALPNDNDSSRIIYFLQQEALKDQLIARNIVISKSTSKNQTPGSIKDIVISLDVSGSYESLNNFMDALENSDRIFEITNVSFKSDTVLTQTVNASLKPPVVFDFNIQMKTHSY